MIPGVASRLLMSCLTKPIVAEAVPAALAEILDPGLRFLSVRDTCATRRKNKLILPGYFITLHIIKLTSLYNAVLGVPAVLFFFTFVFRVFYSFFAIVLCFWGF